MRTLLILFAIGAVILIVRHFFRQRQVQGRSASPRSKDVESVRCRVCGVHLPREQALQQGPHYYCCVAHRNQDVDGN